MWNLSTNPARRYIIMVGHDLSFFCSNRAILRTVALIMFMILKIFLFTLIISIYFNIAAFKNEKLIIIINNELIMDCKFKRIK